MLRRLFANPWFALALLTLVFLAFEPTWIELRAGGLPLDLWVQDHFYDFEARRWLVGKDSPPWNWLLYKGALCALYALGAGLIALFLVPPRKWAACGKADAWYADRWKVGYLLACIALLPTLVSVSKAVTDIYVPADTARYFGGKMAPHVRVLEHYPADFLARRAAEGIRPGKSFPAGHASGGFALMAFFFVWPGRWKWAGLALGLAVGWVTGIYKMMLGDHYLSHTLITCALVWLGCVVLAQGREWGRGRRNAVKAGG